MLRKYLITRAIQNVNFLYRYTSTHAFLECSKTILLSKFQQLSVLGTRWYSNSCPKEDDKMVCILNVAEKNDAAKNLAEIMSRGGFHRRDGFSVYNKIYEYEMMLNGSHVRMKMTSVSGHLLNQSFVGSHKIWTACNPVDLFDAQVVKVCQDNMEPIKRTLEKEVKNAHKLIIWTDCDREGENIGFEIIEVCRKIKPNIPVLRAKFSEITPQSVERALRTLGPPDERQNQAVNVRSELDLRIGAAFTRFQTLRLQKVFPGTLGDSIISYGSCQFPTLGFVVERYKAIQQFVPETFWKIKVTHDGGDGLIEFLWKRVRLFNRMACQVLLEQCEDDPLAKVTSVVTKPKSKWRPLPLDTVELEKLGSRKLRMNAKETMRVAEKLYTSGLISYPRTETNIFPPDLALAPLVQMQTVDPNWGAFAEQVAANGPNPRKGKKSDQAHPPIHPTKYANNLQGNEAKLYEFIVRHFLACCSKDAMGQETVVEIDIAAEKFSANGLMIIERNYLEVYPYDKWSDKIMPVYERGQTFEPTSIEMNDGQTNPPPLLTEADLIALMEKHGIGTDATHAEHIETIKNRMYVGMQDTRFVPGELGMGLVEGYDAMGFHMSKPHLRSGLEADLKLICEGRKDPDVVLREQVQTYKNVFIEAIQQANKIDAALGLLLNEPPALAPDVDNSQFFTQVEKIVKCVDCDTGSDMIIKKKKNGEGYFLSCQGWPTCKNVRWLPDSVIGASVVDRTCRQCRGNPKLVQLKFKPRAYAPLLPDEHIGCLGGCDHDLLEILSIQGICQPTTRTIPASNGGGGGHNPGDDRGSGRVMTSQRSNNSTGNVNATGRGRGRGSSASQRSNRSEDDSGFGSMSSNSNRPNIMGRPRPGGTYKPDEFQGVMPSFSNDNNENAIVCSCNENAVKLTVRKEGPNTGRQFYICNKSRETRCNFFLWADDAGSDNTISNSQSSNFNRRQQPFASNNSSSARQTNSFNNSNTNSWSPSQNDSENNPVVCNCQEPAIKLTVNKDNANKGRQFYKCDKPMGMGCNFFLWADENTNTNTNTNHNRGGNNSNNFGSSGFNNSSGFGSRSFNSMGNSFGDDFDDYSQIQCMCAMPAVKRTTMKEGPNQGREFYVCSKQQNEKCNFFKWADETGGGGGGGTSTFGRGAAGTSSGYSGFSSSQQNKGVKRKAPGNGQPKKRRCGVCGEEGHNRKNCPQNDLF